MQRDDDEVDYENEESEEDEDEILQNHEPVNWKSIVQKRIPIVEWLPKYTLGKFFHDILAGLTVGLTEIPQGIAYASVAGLPPEYGLYAGFMGCFVYAVMGSCKDVNIGPTAIMALMVQPHVEALGPDGAVLLTFISGCIIFILGLLHLGFVVEFFSFPVVAGFTCAAALNIATSQINGLLGITGKANEFLEAIIKTFEHYTETRKWDAVLGILSIVFLILMKELNRFGSNKNNPAVSTRRNVISKVIWIFSLARNALVVIFGSIMAYIFKENGEMPFKLISDVGSGLPPLQPPPFSFKHNGTEYDFPKIAEQYSSSIAFVPLIAILETVAIAKAFSKGKTLDATQELLALGICNIFGSFVRSMPVTGSFTRTAVNNASGVKTTLGGILTATMVLLALGFLTSTFTYIPKTTLAAVVITSMFYLFDFEAIGLIWRSKKLDLIPFLVTFLSSLFLGLEYGILIGIGVNLIFVLYPTARPEITITKEKLANTEVFLIVPCKNIQFPAAEYLREKIALECSARNAPVVIDGSNINFIDSTVAKNLQVLLDDMEVRKQKLVLLNFNKNVFNVCLNVDNRFLDCCRHGPLEEVIIDDNNSVFEAP